jgi:hypothetical protein
MPSAPSPRSRADVPLRRLAAIAAVLFVAILALLAGRVHAGADPAQSPIPAASATPRGTAEQPYTEPRRDPYRAPQPPGADDASPYGGGGAPEPSVGPSTQAS